MIKKGDINGDGYNDLILAYKSKGIFVNLNKRGRSFRPKEVIVPSEADLGIPTIVDVDNDGDLDILVEDNDKRAVTTFKNDGRGNFSNSEKLFDLEHKDNYFQVKAIDIDEDGFLDVHLYGRNGIYLYFGKENNKYEEAIIITNGGKPKIYGRISLLDYDRDSKTDIIVHDNYRLGWYKNLGEGQFNEYEQIFSDTIYNYNSKFYDFDLDGDIDFIKRKFDQKSKYISWNRNEGSHFEAVPLFNDIENIHSVYLIESIDLHEPHYVVFTTAQIKLFSHNSTGDLRYLTNLPSTNNVVNDNISFIPSILDFDKDGKLDMLKKVSGKLVCYYNIIDQDSITPIALSDRIRTGKHDQIIVNDLNEDGNPDIILVGSNVVWLRGTAYTTFASGENITYTEDDGYIKKAVIKDIDNDGSPNFIYMTKDGIFYYTKENNHPFGNKHTVESDINGVNSFELADLDTDGDLDLVVTSSDKFSIVWYENLKIP